MNKDELEIKISTLQNLVTQKNDELTDYAAQIQRLNDELKDLNKPKLTMSQFDQLTEKVEYGIGNFDFSDTDNYSIDFGLDYDGRVHCESFEFDNADELAREICEKVYEMFGEANEDDNQLNQD